MTLHRIREIVSTNPTFLETYIIVLISALFKRFKIVQVITMVGACIWGYKTSSERGAIVQSFNGITEDCDPERG